MGSEVGRGSTFSFTVPLKLSAAPRRETSAPAAPLSGPDAVRPLSILLAEDNPVIQKVVQTIVTRRGHRVEVARAGQEALDAVSRQCFDLALMDVEMPELDGYLAKPIRREELWAAVARLCGSGSSSIS